MDCLHSMNPSIFYRNVRRRHNTHQCPDAICTCWCSVVRNTGISSGDAYRQAIGRKAEALPVAGTQLYLFLYRLQYPILKPMSCIINALSSIPIVVRLAPQRPRVAPAFASVRISPRVATIARTCACGRCPPGAIAGSRSAQAAPARRP